VKWTDDRSDLADVAHVVERVDRLRDVGYPAPDYLPPFLVEGGVVVLQREVAGAWRDDLPNDFPDTVLRLNHLQEGMADPGGDWTDYVRMTLTEGADGYCLHATLRNATRETRQLLEWVQSVGRDLGPLPEHDLVHIDFHHRNMLRQGPKLVAVVDWEGCRPGDRAFDLVTFCFGMTHAVAASGVEERVWTSAMRLAGPQALAAYVAHMALRRVDWTIRHHPEEADLVLGHALTYMRRIV
jgi:Phosphotransferase enzyme family